MDLCVVFPALEHVARQKGISTSYEEMSLEAQRRRAQRQNQARRKRRFRGDDAEGPPDKHHDFETVRVSAYINI